MTPVKILIPVLIAFLFFPCILLADVVHLKDGGVVEGDVTDQGDKVIVKIKDGMEVTIDWKNIDRIEKKKSINAEYRERLAAVEDNSADGCYRLGLWCKEHGLESEARRAFDKTLEIEPGHEATHLVLGHKLLDGRWLTIEEYNVIKGLVKYRGRWVTPEKKAALEAGDMRKEWKKRVRKYVSKILDGSESERTMAENTLLAIRDKNAAKALADLLDHGKSHVRVLACRTLAHIKDADTLDALMKAALKDPAASVRKAASAALAATVPYKACRKLLSAFLYNSSGDVRSNALDALVVVRHKSSVPVLIELLVVRVKPVRKESGGLGNGFLGAKPYKVVGHKTISLGRGRKFNLPTFGEFKDKDSAKPREEFNPLVREALMKITGVNFNFDQDRWHKWWNENSENFDELMKPVKNDESE